MEGENLTDDASKLMKGKVNVENFVKAKNKLNNKLKVFENVYKFYKYIIMDEILVSLNKSLKFLTKYELLIISTINKYNTDKDGYLDAHQSRMLVTIIQRYLFDKIFVNYLLPNISKYYNVIFKEDIEKLIDNLKFIDTTGEFIDTTGEKDDKHEKMKNNIITNLNNSKFQENYINKKGEFNDSLNDDKNNNIDYNFAHLTPAEQKDIKDNISNSFINKFETLENKFINIQSTTLWWNILRDSLINELTNSDKEYVKCIIIFIKQMLTESMYNDIIGLEHISLRKNRKKRVYTNDSKLYQIYNYYLKNKLDKIFERLDESNLEEIEKEIKTLSNDFNTKLSNEFDNIDGITSIYHLRKTKITLENKFKSYTDIIQTIINTNKKISENKRQQGQTDITINDNQKVSRHEFREIVETLIIYLKQHLLYFFNIYQSYISDLRTNFQEKLFEISDKLNDNLDD